MAICNITRGIDGGACKNTVAGFKAIYVANYEDYEFTTVSDAEGHLLTGLPAGFETFKFPLKNTGNNYNEPSTSSRDAGTTVFSGTFNMVLTNIKALKTFQIKNMVWGRPIVFAEMENGEILAIGLKRGVEFNSTTNVEGALDGVNAYQLVGVSQEAEPAYFLDSATAIALKASVSNV
jgi:hypothetical protein